MAVLHAIVQAMVLSVLNTDHDLTLSRFGITPALNQDGEHGSMLGDSAPTPMLLAGDADRHLINRPFVSRCGQALADLIGHTPAKLQRPLLQGLMADQNPSGCQHLLDYARAQGKPKVQPDGMAGHLSRKAVAGIARLACRVHPSRMALGGHHRINLTIPQ
jgi:hypothetical protein